MIAVLLLLAGCQENKTVKDMKPIDEHGAGSSQNDVLTNSDSENSTAEENNEDNYTALGADKQQTGSGELSDGIKYTIYSDDTLVLSGKELTANLASEPKLATSISKITTIIFQEDVTYIGSRSCENMTALTSITFGKDTLKICDYAVANCPALTTINWVNMHLQDVLD